MNNCLNCKHWDGPKKKQQRHIEKYTLTAMDLNKGWPEEGNCEVAYLWSTVEVNGDATAMLTVNANHSCNRWEGE